MSARVSKAFWLGVDWAGAAVSRRRMRMLPEDEGEHWPTFDGFAFADGTGDRIIGSSFLCEGEQRRVCLVDYGYLRELERAAKGAKS